ncbi:VOC family protein [Lutimonas zeaxanthinifaciens]|uniref:VOC family protein n=1 Tax=Lutimonas zeaxanthinifaciens TaxID=3060215 RepID=UPI00265D3C64|nr:VOC family protein [Lutimonas sp. YSD2104]WKK67100.1 VOC family protein [Lutimonas sp. YSD2104]
MGEHNNHKNYLEFKAGNLEEVKSFYQECFQWRFKDYGPDYTSFSNSGIAGGFERSEDPAVNGALVVLYHSDLESIKETILRNGGIISNEIFSFPGGRRFHFMDPSGNELAVWSDR